MEKGTNRRRKGRETGEGGGKKEPKNKTEPLVFTEKTQGWKGWRGRRLN